MNAKLVVASPNDTAMPLKALACDHKNNIYWNTKVIKNF